MYWELCTITIAIMVLDFVSGYLNANIQKTVQSTKLREGLYHKGGYVCVIVLAQLLELAMRYADLSQIGIASQLPFTIMACLYIILTEICSILENVGEINPELGTRIYHIFGLDKLAPKNDNGNEH